MQGSFTVGQHVLIGSSRFRVVRYQRVGDHWEVVLYNEAENRNMSVACEQLAAIAQHVRTQDVNRNVA